MLLDAIRDAIREEFIRDEGLAMGIVIIRVAGAALLSGIIGLEREMRKNTAGLRTHMVISVASAMFALISLELMHLSQGDRDALRMDPLRLIEAVTSGVAFLAAGMIVYARGDVKGLTTGAGMWLSSSIGVACGLGYWGLALTATVSGFLVIGLLRHVELLTGIKTPRRQREEAETRAGSAADPGRTEPGAVTRNDAGNAD